MVTEAEVRARISTFAAPDVEPVLTLADLEVVMDLSKRVDRYGVRPIDDGWEDTYDWNYAVAQCWFIKAGRVADRYLFMSGGKMFSRNQYYDHCMKLYHKFLAKADLKSISLETGGNLELIPNNWNGPYLSGA